MSVNMSGMEVYSSFKVNDNKVNKKNEEYGKTIGEPKLSEQGKKYYEELKKKFSNMDFILVSSDMKEQAQSQAASYANPVKTVVLIDEAKIEQMATDEAFRNKYEGILSGATDSLNQMKQSIEKTGANVKGYGIQINDDGTASYFAVLQKSSDAQRSRIEQRAEEKLEEKKSAKKKAAKEAREERLEERRKSKAEDSVTISASSIEELMKKISDYTYEERGNNIQTEAELKIGQNIDFQV